MHLLDLPVDLLQLAADFLDAEKDINSFAQINRQSYSVLNPYLYRRNSLKLGSSALLWAAQRGSGGTARACLSEGADVAAFDKFGRTPLFLAASKGSEEVVKVLLATRQVDANSKDCFGCTPLTGAASYGHEAVVRLLLATATVDADWKDNFGFTPLNYAASWGHKAVVRLLVATGKVDADLKDNYDCTPLSIAVSKGDKAVVTLLSATRRFDMDSTDLL
ncbi:hypothetical protein PMG11_11061 [Penicillium brasilianum]|uniref:Uncharacterized protein n=1 Tax=Penicillium brasilianum TaxID=104259 RepID=A0A0F7U0W8_PENBI|nr:hypothetical protein PMG11_11061 [Penicillium brasilianum]